MTVIRKGFYARPPLTMTSNYGSSVRNNQTQLNIVRANVLNYVRARLIQYDVLFGRENRIGLLNEVGVLENTEEFPNIPEHAYQENNYLIPQATFVYNFKGFFIKVSVNLLWTYYPMGSHFTSNLEVGTDIDSEFNFVGAYYILGNGKLYNNTPSSNILGDVYYEKLSIKTLSQTRLISPYYETDKCFWFISDFGVNYNFYDNNNTRSFSAFEFFHLEFDVDNNGQVDPLNITLSCDVSMPKIDPNIVKSDYDLNVNSNRRSMVSIRFRRDTEESNWYVLNDLFTRKTIHKDFNLTHDSNNAAILYEMNKPFDGVKTSPFESMISVPCMMFGETTHEFEIDFHGENKKFIYFKFGIGDSGILKSDARESNYFTALEWNDV